MEGKFGHIAERGKIRISDKQKKIIQEFLDTRKNSGGKSGRGLDDTTLGSYELSLYRFAKFAGRTFDLKKANKKKMKEIMARINGSVEIKPNMMEKLYTHVKVFYKCLQGDDECYPESVAWMKVPKAESRKISPKDLFTEEEVMKMIDTADNPRDKAIIALFYDSAMRPIEMKNLKIKDVDLEDKINEPSHVNAYGKTPLRKIPILFSAPFLARYIKGIAHNDDPDMPLWRTIGHWSRLNKALGEGGINRVFWDIAVKAGIRIRAKGVMCPYLIRHTRLTICAKTMSQQELNAFAGWTPNSGMASIYIHLAESDIDNAVLKMNGVKREKKDDEVSKIQPKACPKCKSANAYGADYCDNCGSPMDTGVAMGQLEREKKYNDGLQKLVEAGVDKALAERFGDLAERYKFAKEHNKNIKSIEDLDDVAFDVKLDKMKNEAAREVASDDARWRQQNIRHREQLEKYKKEELEEAEKEESENLGLTKEELEKLEKAGLYWKDGELKRIEKSIKS